MLDSGKLNPAMVSVPLLPVDAGEPPPDDPQALPIRLSPRIEANRARKAQLRIRFSSWSHAGARRPARVKRRRGRRPAPTAQFETQRYAKGPRTSVRRQGYQVAGSATGAAARPRRPRSRALAE